MLFIVRHKINGGGRKWGRISRTQNRAYYMTKGQNFTPIGTTDAINSTISINHGAGKPPPFPPPFLKHNFASQGSPIDTQILFYGIFRVLHNIPHIYDPFSRFPPPFLPYSKSSGKMLNFFYLSFFEKMRCFRDLDPSAKKELYSGLWQYPPCYSINLTKKEAKTKYTF